MSSALQQIRELRGKTGAAAVVGLGAAALWITALAIVGAIAVSNNRDGGGKVAAGIETADGPLEEAPAGRSVVVRLADDVDVARGDLLAGPGQPPRVTRELTATVCWLADTALEPGSRWRVRQASRDVRDIVERVDDVLDVTTGARRPADRLALNDIGAISLRTAEPLVIDPYPANRRTGGFLLVDDFSAATVGAGMVAEVPPPESTSEDP